MGSMLHNFRVALSLTVIALLALCCSGCLVVPIGHKETPASPNDARALTPQMIATLRPAMSREEVLLQLGEPDFWWDGQRVFAYQWTMSTLDVIWVAVSPGSIFGGDIRALKFHTLLMEFDANGQLKRWEQFASNSAALGEADVISPRESSVLALKSHWRSTGG